MRAHISPLSISDRRRGFTIVELLVVIVITGIIASMVTVALAGAQRQAMETRTKSMIDALNLLILQIYEEESLHRVNLPTGFSTVETRSLSLLMWKRDWLRCALPDRREDLSNPVAVPYPNSIEPTGVDGDVFPPGTDNKLIVPPVGSGLNATGIRSQQVLSNRRYIARTIGAAKAISVSTFAQLVDNNLNNGEWTAQYQSSECLYMILSTHMVNGIPASDILRQRDIGDLDEDGMPEVLDPWGNPVGFMRWPVGLSLTPDWNDPVDSPESTTTRSDWEKLAAMKGKFGKDSLDILYADPRYSDNNTVPPTDYPQAEDPFPLHPIIVSSGGDGVFDLYGLDAAETQMPPGPPPVPSGTTFYLPPTIDYTSGGWPNTSPSFLRPTPPFPANSPFIDPYMDGLTIDLKLGARVDFNGDGVDDSADNVLPAFVL